MILGNFVGYLGVESMSKLNKLSVNFKSICVLWTQNGQHCQTETFPENYC